MSADRTLAILSFHKIGNPSPSAWSTWFYIPEATFAAQLGYLAAHGWSVIDAPTFLRGLAEPESLPARAALLTFDDGYRSLLEIGLPWLEKFGFPGMVFVPTSYVGGCNRFDSGNEPEEPICSWDDLRELERRGVSVQSHGASHRRLSDLDPGDQEEELVRSKAALEVALGKPVDVFAYPYGDRGGDPEGVALSLERAGYRAACLYGGGLNALPGADRYGLARVAMGPDTDLESVLGRGDRR